MKSLSHLTAACIFLACSAWAPAEPVTPELLEALAKNGHINRLQPLLLENKAMAQQVVERLHKAHPAAYLEEVDREAALNALARLLPDPALEKSLRQSGQWIDDDRWGTAQQDEAVVDLGRSLRHRREIEIADQLVKQGAYRAALEHVTDAIHYAPFRSRGQLAIEGARRRAAVELLLDTQGVGEGNIGMFLGLLADPSNTPKDDPVAAESYLATLLEMIRAAERAGLPMSAARAYTMLDSMATKLNLPCTPAMRFILGSQLFHLEWERDPSVDQQAQAEFERLAALLDSQSQLDPYWAARIAQSLVPWREICAGSWFDERLEKWQKKFAQPQFGYARLRGQVAGAAQLRRAGQSQQAERLLQSVESQLQKLPLELAEWKEVLGKPAVCDEVALLAQDFHSERARSLGGVRALLEYRAALQYAFRPRDIVDILNEEAPLVRSLEEPGFEAENTRAMQGSRKLLHRFGMLNAFAELGLYQADRGNKVEAAKNLSQAIELFEKYLVDLRPSQARREALRSRLKEVYERSALLKLQQGDSQGAFQALARNQQIQQTWSAPTLRSQDANVQAQLDSAQRSKEQVALQQAETGGSPELLAKTKSEFFSVVRDLRSSGKNYGGLLAVQPVEFAQLQKQLPADTLLVQYYPTSQTLYYFIVSRQGFKVRSLALPKERLFGQVRDFRRTCRQQGMQAALMQSWNWGSADGREMMGLLGQLHKALIQPLREDLQGYKVLAIVPTENLLYLPFPALAEARQGKPHFLVEDVAVVTLLRATDLARLDKPAHGSNRLLALGNPDGSLAGAQREVEELGKSFPLAVVAVLQQATASRLTQTSHPPDLIHLATHAILDQRQPNNSYLVMAGIGGVGRLTVPQIFDLPLQQTRLVTLSACETDLGEAEPGAAVSSLAEAFWVAGAPSMVASLWAVEDQSTGKLMVDFYRKLGQGQPLGQSLRQAQLGLLKEGRTSHPFFWAPFVLIGNWQ